MRFFLRVVIMVVLGAGLHCSSIGDATAADGMLPSLSDVVLFGVWHVNELKGMNPAEEETCVRRYLESIPPGSPLEYWLRVEKNDVVGSIDGAERQAKRIPLDALRNRLIYPHFKERFPGRIFAGELFRRPFGSRFEFILQPVPTGWEVIVRESGRDENLSRLTPPLHFAPNPREIEGWHLSQNPSGRMSRPYGAPAGPDHPRRFIFSPEVGGRIDGSQAGRPVTAEEMEEVQRFGRGLLTIEDFRLEPGEHGCPRIGWMKFSVQLEGGY